MFRCSLIIYLLLFNLISLNISTADTIDHEIAVLVNDEIITSYDITQRMKMNAIINNINITPEVNRMLTKNVIEDLIDEKLKYEKSMEYNIKVDDKEYLSQEEIFFKSTIYKKKELIEILKTNNIRYLALKNFLIGEIAWNKLIVSLYFNLASASQIEIDEIISKNPNISQNVAEEIVIQKQLDLRSNKLIRDMRNEATIEYK